MTSALQIACHLLDRNGVGATEAARANVEDLRVARGQATLTVVRGFTQREIDVPLAPITKLALAEHLAGRTSGPLLVDPLGHPLAPVDVSTLAAAHPIAA